MRGTLYTLRAALPMSGLVTMAIILIYLVAGPANPGLVYIRDLPLPEDPWRWFSAHFVHADPGHLAWNVVATVILAVLLAQQGFRRLLPMTLACILAVNIGLVMDGNLARYCGFSGVLNGWFAVLLLTMWRNKERRYLAAAIGTGAIAKIGWELLTHAALFTDHSWSTVPVAHAAGALGGIAWVFLVCKPAQSDTSHSAQSDVAQSETPIDSPIDSQYPPPQFGTPIDFST